jgi:hypothetical protein
VSPHFRVGRSASAWLPAQILVNLGRGFECKFCWLRSTCPLSARIDAKACSTTTGLRQRMIRTVWLATICLAMVSALAVGKALMTRADTLITERPTDRTAIGSGPTQDTLSKADRLEITYVRQEVPAASALLPTKPIVPAVSPVTPPVENKIISRHWHDPNASPSSAPKSKQIRQAASDKKSKTVDRKGNQAADRSKPAEPVKPCSRPGAVGDLLRSLNLSPACDS